MSAPTGQVAPSGNSPEPARVFTSSHGGRHLNLEQTTGDEMARNEVRDVVIRELRDAGISFQIENGSKHPRVHIRARRPAPGHYDAALCGGLARDETRPLRHQAPSAPCGSWGNGGRNRHDRIANATRLSATQRFALPLYAT